ncbi:hypothetical protein PHLCEN_2v2378 [Hermanssonia centrifuga]|uniref:Uncharacterized protein n=1 Tax=Hermanssonia centrifuga TaxID=98765 RepID=A0A2R6RLZ7_9APHY|nr:hypothetical protein PHLCEN_2v2378 [Hermanssonia centrifuga]
MSSIFTLPQPVRNFFSLFPITTYPPVHSPHTAHRIEKPTLWIHPPRSSVLSDGLDTDLLSSDVECLKWQAYLALRGINDVAVRWDVSPDGAVDDLLPNLHVPLEKGDDGGGELLPAHLIPEWVEKRVGELGSLEGYDNEEARDESRAWVTLLEGNIHAALASLSLFF